MWQKHFKLHSPNTSGTLSPISGVTSIQPNTGFRNYQSMLPEVYVGCPNRIDRYNQYENMDMNSDISAALDIIAEFCTQTNQETKTPFDVHYHETPTDNEVKIIADQLRQWSNLNEFNERMFKVVRNTIKYGDQVFLRDPETFKLLWSDMSKVTKVIVNESNGKTPEQYVLKDIAPNFQNLTITAATNADIIMSHPQTGGYNSAYTPVAGLGGGTGGSRFSHSVNEGVISAEHILHIAMSEGLDPYWPFGISILEKVFKVFKQVELLEDAVIIYRIQRAPERRVFKIDVGGMPQHLAMAYVERIKNEIHQRRIPTQSGGGTNMMDASYSPISLNEDFFFPISEGRGSSVETLPGGSSVGEVTDLRLFTNKMIRGLGIPVSYLPTMNDEPANSWNDGKVGQAVIQEWRFNQYCKRIQNCIARYLDKEFKMFLKFRGINIDSSVFELRFNEPQNFSKYRQMDLDAQCINSFSSMEAYPYMSKRFLMTRYLGLSEEEILENERLWAEERSKDKKTKPHGVNMDVRNVGITPGAITSDMDMIGDMGGMPPEGGEGMPPEGGAPMPNASPMGSAPAGPAASVGSPNVPPPPA